MTVKVLIVEDEPIVARVLCRHVINAGHEAQHAASIPEALTLARGTRFQLILTDIDLPGISGLAAVAILKKVGSAPVLVMTGNPIASLAEDARAMGAIGVIAKPFDFTVLNDWLARLPLLELE
ncbi:MAG: response regulator [Elusimicrobiota bacterium]